MLECNPLYGVLRMTGGVAACAQRRNRAIASSDKTMPLFIRIKGVGELAQREWACSAHDWVYCARSFAPRQAHSTALLRSGLEHENVERGVHRHRSKHARLIENRPSSAGIKNADRVVVVHIGRHAAGIPILRDDQ